MKAEKYAEWEHPCKRMKFPNERRIAPLGGWLLHDPLQSAVDNGQTSSTQQRIRMCWVKRYKNTLCTGSIPQSIKGKDLKGLQRDLFLEFSVRSFVLSAILQI